MTPEARLDADPATRVCGLPQALDMADQLHLHGWLPTRTHAKLTTEPLVLDWLIAEDAREDIVSEDLWFSHGAERNGVRLSQRSGLTPVRIA